MISELKREEPIDMKKLLLLGGTRYLIPVIEIAHKLGLYVITCDYLSSNVAHQYSDEYCNISVMEKDSILSYAQECKIDGIMSFACDPGVMTAAYVAEKMELPFQASYRSTAILQDKGLFREYLANHNFNVPHAKRYLDERTPFSDLSYFTWPVIVKPTDSAGSKGVTKANSPQGLEKAIKIALSCSHSHSFIIEDFLDFEGYHSSTDPFTVNGELKFVTYSDQLFDPVADNPYTPSMIIWPSSMKQEHQNELTREIQRLVKLLDMKTGIYNIETCVANNGRPYIMEVSPRGGGCKIAELQKMAYGVDLIENEIRKSVNLPLLDIPHTECNGYWCEMVIHAGPKQKGIFKNISIAPNIKRKHVKLVDISVKRGDVVHPFTGANMSLGDIFLHFDSRDELESIMSKPSQWLQINLE